MIDFEAIKARRPYVTETTVGNNEPSRQYFNTEAEVLDIEWRAANATRSNRYGQPVTIRRVRWAGVDL